jgi:hypothetical protein
MATLNTISNVIVRHAVASRSGGGIKFVSHSALAATVIEVGAVADAQPARITTCVVAPSSVGLAMISPCAAIVGHEHSQLIHESVAVLGGGASLSKPAPSRVSERH